MGHEVVVAGAEHVYALIAPFLPILRQKMYAHLCVEGKRTDTHAHESFRRNNVTETRIFAHEYRALGKGRATGMAVHCDRNALYGAITVYLGPCDETPRMGGLYHTYATLGEEVATRSAHPFSVGGGIVLSPYVVHGVDAVVRRRARMTLNLFF
jgi:hypothetical protein